MPPDDESPTGVQVRHVMVRDPVSVPPTAPLMEVIQLMSRTGIGAVLVGEKGRVDGIFTEARPVPLRRGEHRTAGGNGRSATG